MSTEVRAGKAFVEVGLRSKLKDGVRQIQNQMSAVSSGLRTFGTGLAAAGASATAAFGGLLASLVWPTKYAADMETTRAGFLAILRDGGKVEGLMTELKKFGAETPFEFPELASSAQMLLAFGVPLEQVMGTLKAIGDVSSGINAPLGEIAEIYGKARVQGRLFMEDINQLTGRGIPVIQELAKQFGVTDAEVRKLVENGQVNFSHLEVAFKALTTGSGIFTDQMAAKSKTLNGVLSTLKDNIAGAFLPIGEALAELLKPVVSFLNAALTPIGSFIAANKQMVAIVAVIATAGAGLGVAMLTLGGVLIGVGSAIAGIVGVLPLISAGFAALGTAIGPILAVAVPILGVAAAILATGAAVLYLANRAGVLKPTFDALMNTFTELAAIARQTFGGIADALTQGDISKAAQILWAGVKVAFFTGAKEAYDSVVWLMNNGVKLLEKFAVALGETLFDIFSQIPRILKAALTGGESITNIIASALNGKLGPMLENQIKQAQSELDSLTAKPIENAKATESKLPAPGEQNAKPNTNVNSTGKTKEESEQAFKERIQSLRDEISELKLGADAADILKLRQQGLNDEQIKAIQDLQKQREEIQAQKKAREEAKKQADDAKKEATDRAKQLAEEVRTPFEIMQDKIDEINRLEAGDFIDRKTADLQRGKANDEFQKPMRDAIKNGRNNVAEINTQAAMDIVLRNQRTFAQGSNGAKKNPLEDLAKEQRDLLKVIAGQSGKGTGSLTVNTRTI